MFAAGSLWRRLEMKFIQKWLRAKLRAKTYFISHSYADAELGLTDHCIRMLPSGVRPFVFPAITVSPEERVSDDLVAAILRCDGLIHIKSERSSQSVWVNFERDFAARNGLPVFCFDPATSSLTIDRSHPLTPNIVVWKWGDPERADMLLQEVDQHLALRNFVINQSGSARVPKDERVFEDYLNNNIVHMEHGAQLIVFACNGGPYDDYDLSFFAHKSSFFKGQTILAALEPLQDGNGSLLHWSKNSASVELFGLPGYPPIDWRRVDDLVVRLFAMMHQTRQRSSK